MRRIRELIALAKTSHPHDDFFSNFEWTIEVNADARAQFQAYERALMFLDPESWEVLRQKALAHFTDHRKGQRKQGFFNQLNEAFAYQYLIRRGYSRVRILREAGKTQPDIEYMDGSTMRVCEVKTIGISDEVIARQKAALAHSSSIYYNLSPQFLSKLSSTLEAAAHQIQARTAQGLTFVIVHFDDFTLEHYRTYRRQLAAFIRTQPAENVYIKIGLLGRKHIAKGSLRAARHGT